MSPLLAPASASALKRHFLSRNSKQYARLALQAVRQGCASDLKGLIATHPLSDDWLEFHAAALRDFLSTRKGEIYLLAHPTIGNLYKIGQTGKGTRARLTSLHSAGVVGRFVVVKSWPVLDRFHVESLVHRDLQDRRRYREFFEGTWQELSTSIEESVMKEERLLHQAGLIESSSPTPCE